MKSEASGDMVFAVKSGIESDTTIAPPNQFPILSPSIPNELKDEYEIEQHTTSQPAASASVSTLVDGPPGLHGTPHRPHMATSAPIPASVLPQLPNATISAIQSAPPRPTDAADVV
jgi:hypothetical protein